MTILTAPNEEEQTTKPNIKLRIKRFGLVRSLVIVKFAFGWTKFELAVSITWFYLRSVLDLCQKRPLRPWGYPRRTWRRYHRCLLGRPSRFENDHPIPWRLTHPNVKHGHVHQSI